MRRPCHIDGVVRLLNDDPDLDSAISVSEVAHSPFWMLRRAGSVLRPFVDDNVDYSVIRRQELEQVYQPNGAVYATRRRLLRDRGVIFSAFAGGNTGYLIMDRISSLDIDTEADLLAVEAAMARH